jgi:hypothetical protein
MLVFLQTGLTNACTEGTNSLIKAREANAYGFRNRHKYAAAYGCTAPGEHAGCQRGMGSARSRSKSLVIEGGPCLPDLTDRRSATWPIMLSNSTRRLS